MLAALLVKVQDADFMDAYSIYSKMNCDVQAQDSVHRVHKTPQLLCCRSVAHFCSPVIPDSGSFSGADT